MKQRRDLTDGAVAGHLAALGLPLVVGVAGVLSVSLADTFYLGQLGTDELAAISFAFPVIFTVTSIGIGMSAGAASVASRAIGSGDSDGAERLATDSILLSALVTALISVIGWFLSEPLFALLGAEERVLDLVSAYMRIWFLGAPLLVVPMVAMGLMRANGDAVPASAVMVGGAVANIALAPVLIFGLGPSPQLGVAGAAWAGVIARTLGFVAAMAIIIWRERLLTAEVPSRGEFLRSARRISRVAVPATFSNMINPLSISIVTALFATYGKEAVAAFGVATRIETFATIPMLALSGAIGPVAGQNWGRGFPARTRQAMRDSFIFCILCGLVLGGGLMVFGNALAGLFTDDSVVRNLSVSYLVLVGLTLGGYGIVITASAGLNAIDKAAIGLLVTLLRSFVLYVPLAYAAVQFGPPWVAFAGIAVSNVLAGIIVAPVAFRMAQSG